MEWLILAPVLLLTMVLHEVARARVPVWFLTGALLGLAGVGGMEVGV